MIQQVQGQSLLHPGVMNGATLVLSKGYNRDFPGGSAVKKPPANAQLTGQEDPLEEEMTTHAHILA